MRAAPHDAAHTAIKNVIKNVVAIVVDTLPIRVARCWEM